MLNYSKMVFASLLLLTICIPSTFASSIDVVVVPGDLKVDGIHFSADGSVLTSANNILKPNGVWSASSLYSANDVVQFQGISYLCIGTNTNAQPPNSSYWSTFSSQGIQGPKGDPGGLVNKGDWSSTKPYYVDDVVYSQGSSFISIVTNMNQLRCARKFALLSLLLRDNALV